MKLGLWSVVVVLGLTACNKGKSLIDEARKQHDAGNVDGAVATLARVRQEAPGTSEVKDAETLAVTWLVAAADAAPPKSPDREKRAKDALTWDPASGPAQARLCRAAHEAENWDALRTCLGKELAGKRDAPGDVVSPLQAALAVHDAEVQKQKADSDKRVALLQSDDEADWKALQEQFPGTTETTAAAAKLAATQTLCGDLERYWSLYEQFVKDTDSARDKKTKGYAGLSIRFKERAEKEQERKRLLAELRASVGALKSRAENVATGVQAHRIAKGEEQAQRELAKLFTGLANSYRTLEEWLNPVQTTYVIEEHVRDWEESWRAADDAVYKPAREKILGACKK
jgi:hypothetical protein